MKVSFILLLVLIPSMARAAIEKQELSKGVQASAHQRQLHHTNVDRISSPVETSEDAQMFSEKSIAAREAGEVKLHLHRRRRAGREGVRPRTETSDDTPNLSRPGKSGSVLEKEDHHPQDQRSSEGSSDANRRERGDRCAQTHHSDLRAQVTIVWNRYKLSSRSKSGECLCPGTWAQM